MICGHPVGQRRTRPPRTAIRRRNTSELAWAIRSHLGAGIARLSGADNTEAVKEFLSNWYRV